MPIVDLDDVRAELPKFPLSDTTVPSVTSVEHYIARIEAEVRAMVAGLGGVWPDDDMSDAAQMLHGTVLEGVRWLVMRARYALQNTDAASLELGEARAAYKDALARVKSVVAGLSSVQTDEQAGTGGPRIGPASPVIYRSDSLEEFTIDMDRASRRADRRWEPVLW